jgi:hypothetical protein
VTAGNARANMDKAIVIAPKPICTALSQPGDSVHAWFCIQRIQFTVVDTNSFHSYISSTTIYCIKPNTNIKSKYIGVVSVMMDGKMYNNNALSVKAIDPKTVHIDLFIPPGDHALQIKGIRNAA